MKRKLLLANGALAVLALLLLGILWYQNQRGTGEQAGETPAPGEEAAPELKIETDNTIAAFSTQNKPGNKVVVALVATSEGAFAVIHRDEGGGPGRIIGSSSYLEPGQHTNIEVELSESVAAGNALFAMLHKDNGDKKFNAADDPAVTREGQTVQYRFEVGQ